MVEVVLLFDQHHIFLGDFSFFQTFFAFSSTPPLLFGKNIYNLYI